MAAIEARDGASAASTSASRTSGSTFDLDLLPHDVLLSVVRQLDGGDLARLGVPRLGVSVLLVVEAHLRPGEVLHVATCLNAVVYCTTGATEATKVCMSTRL